MMKNRNKITFFLGSSLILLGLFAYTFTAMAVPPIPTMGAGTSTVVGTGTAAETSTTKDIPGIMGPTDPTINSEQKTGTAAETKVQTSIPIMGGETPGIDTTVNTGTAAQTAIPGGNLDPSASSAGGAYQNQEKIPGFGQTTSFPTYLKQIVNFGFAAIGILAMFMLMIGAYQYLMAAGNIAKEESAKTTISSAFSGLVLGLVAFLLLRTINPDLVSFNLATLQGGLTGGGAGSTANQTQQPYTGSTGNGSCEANQGQCQASNLSCFGSAANSASQICGYESRGGNPLSLSKTDITQDGKSFSIGLFQLNLTQHDLGMGCTSAFSGKNSNATIINQGLYDQCVAKAQDPSFNTSYACQLYSGRGNFGDWKNTVSKCGL